MTKFSIAHVWLSLALGVWATPACTAEAPGPRIDTNERVVQTEPDRPATLEELQDIADVLLADPGSDLTPDQVQEAAAALAAGDAGADEDANLVGTTVTPDATTLPALAIGKTRTITFHSCTATLTPTLNATTGLASFGLHLGSGCFDSSITGQFDNYVKGNSGYSIRSSTAKNTCSAGTVVAKAAPAINHNVPSIVLCYGTCGSHTCSAPYIVPIVEQAGNSYSYVGNVQCRCKNDPVTPLVNSEVDFHVGPKHCQNCCQLGLNAAAADCQSDCASAGGVASASPAGSCVVQAKFKFTTGFCASPNGKFSCPVEAPFDHDACDEAIKCACAEARLAGAKPGTTRAAGCI